MPNLTGKRPILYHALDGLRRLCRDLLCSIVKFRSCYRCDMDATVSSFAYVGINSTVLPMDRVCRDADCGF